MTSASSSIRSGRSATLPAAADDALRGAGLRVTESRVAVYNALARSSHASADDVFAAIVVRMPRTSRQSVYNALSDFAEAGIVRRIEPAGRPMLFELRVDDNHHHVVCVVCGAVEDVDCVVGHAPCLAPSDTHGYALQAAEVTFWGTCPACAATAS
ncbi:MAG: Fur family transcriptional regulator [Candidatus Microbacterium phytovorans]|uniref:Fur family transcriptional regulator n=1 Tax=Candidatus Microbacterium phytovorans TaxID=3121374 RepID=A0AAJ5W3B9_9MICO|nr:Fur family transcriptional regulator [Microbacterium sp.]WEK13817.1 MAG: Fur family transcriptional regulator [Microbacterium sp.]